jgi:acetyl esterase/lipase
MNPNKWSENKLIYMKIQDRVIILFGLIISILINSCSSKETINPPSSHGNIINDVVYGSAKDWLGQTENLAMDIYQPVIESGKKYPLVLLVHGGGFVTGDKNTAVQKCQILADSGFVTVSINYRIGWDAGTDTCDGNLASFADAYYRGMQDANAALRFLVSKANEYHIDTNWIFLSGASAGADILLAISYIDNNYANAHFAPQIAKLGSLQSADNNIKATFTVKGISSIAGGLLDSTLIHNGKAYPTISFQGEEDEVVPVNSGTYLNCASYPMEYGSLCQYRQLVANNTPAVAHILPGAGHGNNGDSGFDNPFMMGNTACFFHNIMREKTNIQSGIYTGVINSCP